MLFPLLLIFLAGFALILGFFPVKLDNSPKLQLNIEDPLVMMPTANAESRKKGPQGALFLIMSKLAVINRPLAMSPLGRRVFQDLGRAKSRLTVEEFFLIKEVMIVALIVAAGLIVMRKWIPAAITVGVGFALLVVVPGLAGSLFV